MATFRANSVILKQKTENVDEYESICVLPYKDDEKLSDFRKRIYDVFDFVFDFWDDRLPGRVRESAEKLLPIEEFGGTLVVIKRLDPSTPIDVDLSSVSTDLASSPAIEIVVPSQTQKRTLVCESQLIGVPAKRVWESQTQKLILWTKQQGQDDHEWKVKIWDEDGKVLAHLDCLECSHQYSARSKVDNPTVIKNLFSNFKYKHIKCDAHVEAYCKKRGIPMGEVCKESLVNPLVFDHGSAVKEGEGIVEQVNETYDGPKTPFLVTGSAVPGPVRAFLYKVRCTYCNHSMELVPKQRNLEHNLLTHLSSKKHLDGVQLLVAGNQAAEAIRTGKRGRPKVDPRDQTASQTSVLNFFKSDRTEGASSSKGLDLGLTCHCWGYWLSSVSWTEYTGNVKGLLDDQQRGKMWYPEPYVNVEVYNPCLEKPSVVRGCFRHIDCAQISQLGYFKNLMCSKCFSITLEDDFRGRVIREAKAQIKRGDRSTENHLRIDYMTVTELRKHARDLNENRRKERLALFSLRMRVCALSVKRRRLDEMLGDAVDKKNIKLFLKNIVNAHVTGAFGGKEGLWEFFKDIGKNILRKARGVRYSRKTKAIAQAMLQFGGRQVVHCFSDNLCGPSLKTLKRDRAKLVSFRAGLRPETFREVAKVLAAAKKKNNIVGDVPILLAEDETRIKPRARWEAKHDVLIGFCGSKEDHVCSFGLEIEVGNGVQGYEKIIETFANFDQAMYSRVIIVNPLHENLPRLCLCATATCNRFTAGWVRDQWVELKKMWDLYCRDLVGPIIGHASDGDSRRRKLMIEDYLGKNNDLNKYSVGWEGWKMSVSILPNGDLYGFGDQDQPHNGKKLINPLDRVSNLLVLGDQVPLLGHVEKVYNIFSQDEHGLCQDDVMRTDRQNWAGPQRLASRKVQHLLHELWIRKEERTLGTEMYLEIVADYIDIFFSVKLDLKNRIVKAAKVSFFFRFWRLWLKYGDHTVGGNTSKLTEKNMVSIQAFHDVNMSCHFVVLLICLFRDKFPYLKIPFHLLGSDCCEFFFSKVGGMSGHERNYDFGSLLDSAVGLNRLSSLEFGEEGLKIGRSHNKQNHIWTKLHPLVESNGEICSDLKDYSNVETNDMVVNALKEGLQEARYICVKLQMSPHNSVSATAKRWWLTPWHVEDETWKEEVSKVSELPNFDEDECQTDVRESSPRQRSDEEELDDPELELENFFEWPIEDDRALLGLDGECHVNNLHEENELQVLGHEVRHVISESFGTMSEAGHLRKYKIDPTVMFEGKFLYKSTLVSQLVGNPHLSKDRLTRVKQALYMSSGKRKVSNPSNTCLVDIGIDCAVLFEASNCAEISTRSTVAKSTGTREKGKTPHHVDLTKHDFWIGRVQVIRRKHNGKWLKSVQPLDLLDRPTPEGSTQLLFHWYKPVGYSRTRFTYEVNDPSFIDIEMVMCTVTMSLQNGVKPIWCLHPNDKQVIDEHIERFSEV